MRPRHVVPRVGRCFATMYPDNAATQPWRTVIRVHVRQVIGSQVLYPDRATGVLLGMLFVLPRRVAEPKLTLPPHTRKPDVDKLARAVMDALSLTLYADDSQVVGFLRCYKRTARPGETAGLHLSWASVAQTPPEGNTP